MTNDQWMDREKAVLSQTSHRPHDPKSGLVFSRGLGARLWDVEGRDYIDFTCGYSASNFGHAFEPLVEVATKQLACLTHLTQEPHIWRAPLAEKLIESCGFPGSNEPGGFKVHFNATGARAVETAWKAAYSYRPGRLITLAPSYHGRSLATSALSETTLSLSDFVPNVFHQRRSSNEFPYCNACAYNLKFPSCQIRCLDNLIQLIEEDAPSISAILVEPALGARGYVFPPAEYWHRLRQATSAAGILMIADEIQMGLGRCGTMLLSTSQGWQPDLVVLGKSLGGGIVPISAVVGRREVIDALPMGSESETFACTPLAAAIGLEVLNQLNSGKWLVRGCEAGEKLRQFLKRIGEMRYPGLAIQGQGACAVADFISCFNSLEDAQLHARKQAVACRDQGVLVHFSGPLSTRIVLLPPITIGDEDLDEAMRRLSGVWEC